MSSSDDRSQDPWTDPQTHLDTDPVNADPEPDPAPAQPDGTDEDES
jgi:hypothetical protein